MPLLNSVQRDHVRNYKYHGGDTSPLYQYVLSPLAQICVDHFIPTWMAPNVITLLGLLFSLSAMILTIIFDPELTGSFKDGTGAPRWLHLYTAICIFLYQTLDNMDGKQARRTGSSSALGMLFDHGCDAANAGITIISMSSVMATGWTNGSMVLPPFNGPTEGLCMAQGIGIMTFFLSSEFLHTSLFDLPTYLRVPDNTLMNSLTLPTVSHPAVTPFAFMFLIVITAAVITPIYEVYKVALVLREENESLTRALFDLVPFLVFFFSLYFYNLHSKVALYQYPVVTVMFYCVTFADMVIRMMVAHITKTRLDSEHRYFAWLTLCLLLVALYKEGTAEEGIFLLVLTALSFANTGFYFYEICHEFAETLNINIFSLQKRKGKNV